MGATRLRRVAGNAPPPSVVLPERHAWIADSVSRFKLLSPDVLSLAGASMRAPWPAWRRSFGKIRDLALPNQCALCGNLSQRMLCDGSDEAYWNEPRLRCPVCALPMPSVRRGIGGERMRCGSCIAEPPLFDATFALADYRAPLDTLALDLKFHARLETADEIARHLHAAYEASDLALPDVIAPVPLSRRRLNARGYNQAWAIAKPLGRRLGVRAQAVLVERFIDTAPQSKLDLEMRRRNVGSAFRVMANVRGAHVAIVDDVMTSGATLDALARTLKTAGARRVTNFVGLGTPKD
jgi:ComF family protein